MKKILMIILLLVILEFKVDVLAKEIVINGVSYDDSNDIEGDGFKYQKETKTLNLDGYNGGIIKYDDCLKINVISDSLIKTNGSQIGIDSSEIVMDGNGKLNIEKGTIAINANKITINNINLHIKEFNVGIMAIKSELVLNNIKMIIENCNMGIYAATNMFFNQSCINIINSEYGVRRSGSSDLSIENSDVYIETNNYCFDQINVNLFNKSRMVLKSKKLAITNKGLNILLSNEYYVTNDYINYLKDLEYENYKVVKIAEKDEIDNLVKDDSIMLINFDLEDEKDDQDKVFTEGEYTENEYEKIEVINPQTFDKIYYYLIFLVISLFGLISIVYLWSKYA